MFDLYYWPTPNGQKITIFMEEASLPYRILPVNIGRGDQFKPEFLAIAPNNRIPALVDPKAKGGPLGLFESGAILQYLGEKTGRFLPQNTQGRYRTLQWLYWQMAGLGPMAGQNYHFGHYAPERIPYAIDRYVRETARLYGVLDRRLGECEFLNGEDYSIADMACYPWIVPYRDQRQDLADFPHVKRWFDAIADRPAVQRAYALGAQVSAGGPLDEEARRQLFGARPPR
jgi:GST-like protein